MIELIERLESKGLRLCINPQKTSGKWYWVAGVYVGDERKADWVHQPTCEMYAGYKTYREALEALINHCKKKYKVE